MLRKLDKKIVSQLCLVSDHIWLLMIILLATVLRLFHLGKQSLWLDESLGLVFASLPLKTSIEAILTDGGQPPLD